MVGLLFKDSILILIFFLLANSLDSLAGNPPVVSVALSVDANQVIFSASQPVGFSFPTGEKFQVSKSVTIRSQGLSLIHI